MTGNIKGKDKWLDYNKSLLHTCTRFFVAERGYCSSLPSLFGKRNLSDGFQGQPYRCTTGSSPN